MDRYELAINYKNESFYWWFMGRRRITFTLLEKYLGEKKNCRFLDAGCGTGIILKDLSHFGESVGIDISWEALEWCRRRDLKNLIVSDISALPFKEGCFDFVSILGVLVSKWVNDEMRAINEIYRVIKKGGLILSDEGAFRILMSRHNERVGAIRRYRKNDIQEIMKNGGFEILRISYWNMFTFPLFFIVKILDKFMPNSIRGFANMELPIPGFINKFFIYLLYLESYLLKFVDLPFGASIITLGLKL